MKSSFSNDATFEAAEYTRKPGTRRPAAAGESGNTSRLRLLFFGVAALWGFLIGVLTLGVAAQLSGMIERVDPWVVVALLPGAGLALAGAALAASAYRGARRSRAR